MFADLIYEQIKIFPGDCMTVLPTMAEDSIDASVCDPPYHLQSIVKRYGGDSAAPAQFGKDGAYARASAGFMGRKWDGGDIAFRVETWREVYRVLKPGAHLLAFGGTRTFHRMACAIEDAGFEIRDTVLYLYGSGFPKSHDVSKGIDRAAGAEREIVGPKITGEGHIQNRKSGKNDFGTFAIAQDGVDMQTAPATAAARQWEGWGTALKPACEPIVLARKPLSERTVAANVLRWGTGAINVDGCRIGTSKNIPASVATRSSLMSNLGDGAGGTGGISGSSGFDPNVGRWPANLIHDGSDEVVAAFPDVHGAGSERPHTPGGSYDGTTGIGMGIGVGQKGFRIGDEGSAARFFYTAKADSDDRIGSKHPTVKPLDLMQYLCRLICPPKGLVLDPFAGSGTTGEAAFREGMRAVLIEREAEYLKDIERRIELLMAGPDERAFRSQKAKQSGKSQDSGPLFGGKSEWDEMWAQPFDRPELVWGK